MNILIEKFKISNFLSFFGEYEVNLKPHTTIMCNFYEGKDDFFRAVEFVLGANLPDLRIEKPLDLVHKVLREEFLINRDIHSYVEITIGLPQEKKQLKFCKGVINGASNVRLEHKISDLVTSSLLYEEKLNYLGIHIKRKNLIFYKTYFDSAIWGSPEDLEQTICTCLRESYLLEDWRKINKEVEYLTKLKNRTAMKNYNSMKSSNSIIAKYAKKFKTFSSHMKTCEGEIPQPFTTDSSSESTPSLIGSKEEEINLEDAKKKEQDIFELEIKINFLAEKLHGLKLKEALLTSYLHHEEIKLGAKPVNASILQNRISFLKTKVQEKERQMSEIWDELQKLKFELEKFSRKISFMLCSLQELQNRKFLQNRFTQYGRFYEYLQPSRYVQLFKQIIGVDIFYAHLCDSVDEIFGFLTEMKDLEFEHRETFLPFENYSHKLKDVIIASGERGIRINTLEELLIFLCKLKHYQLIDEVPVIVQKDLNYENPVPEDYVIYIQNSIHFTSDGLISLKTEDNDFFLDTETEMEKNLIHLYTEEERGYRKIHDLIFLKWETLNHMNSLENDVLYLKQKWKKSTQTPHVLKKPSPAVEIYEEYKEIFEEYAQESEQCESELQEESFLSEKDSSVSSNEESISVISKDLEDVTVEKLAAQRQLEDWTNEFHLLNATPVFGFKVRGTRFKFQNNLDKTKLFFEKELRKLKKLMREDDWDDFLRSQEWRTSFIASALKDFEGIKIKLKSLMAELQETATARKTRLYQLFNHCSCYLTSTFGHILDEALPFVKLNFTAGEEEVHITSCFGEDKIQIVDIKHFNTLIKFICVFSIFLEIAKFDKVPFMIIDEIEEYFPLQIDSLEAVLDAKTIEKILPENDNQRFHLMMRLGQFLKHSIKKNTPGELIRNNGNNSDHSNGPIQIIYFSKDDLIHAANHYIWIQSQVLPDEYISENCNSFSGIYELNLNN